MNTCNLLEYFASGADYMIKNFMALFVSWPFVVFMIFICLRKHIVAILVKIRKELRVKDNKVNLGAEQQDLNKEISSNLYEIPATTSDKSLKKRKKEYELPEIAQSGLRDYTLEIEAKLKKDLAVSPYKKMDLIIRDSASYRLSTEFERIYRIIFGSQMRLLRHLDMVKTQTVSEVDKFFKHEKRKMPDAEIQLEPWKRFLISQGVMSYKDGEYTITSKGRAFITYVALFNYEDRLW